MTEARKRSGGDDAPRRKARKPFLVRLPEDLMTELRSWAAQDLRSLNGHMEYLLREAVKRRRRAAKREDSAE